MKQKVSDWMRGLSDPVGGHRVGSDTTLHGEGNNNNAGTGGA